MDAKLIELLLQSGIAGVVALVAWKAIAQLYNNMRDDHQKQLLVSQAREDRLMNHLQKSNETLDNISKTMDNICIRITQIENYMIKKE
jgi:hypothetical protein